MKFGIDLGHGVDGDRGAVGRIPEENIIDEIGKILIKNLKQAGHTVVELRPDRAKNVPDSLMMRYNKANYYNVDMCISIHANIGGGRGTEIYTYNGNEFLEAKNVLDNLISLGFKNRGIKDGSHLAMIRRTKSKSMLIEICFLDSDDVDIYKNAGSKKISDAILNGITNSKAEKKRCFVVTNYLKSSYEGYDGVEINKVMNYFKNIRCYLRFNQKGIWIETQYLKEDECEKLKEKLGNLFYEIKYE
ncbi:N-acetylmuramoyl-L-alanine amidase [Clostridium sp. BJN0001]|uniref:N-acetylmuramoyl-L-alanine amidase n=1 Tax=Clostridium sp. BJN0001 TaxID=2930219 RepID=UPI001FD390A4|nr:N-acetylmuramoyl-L-alanine amidase [Clostridium sp. BJN0001]